MSAVLILPLPLVNIHYPVIYVNYSVKAVWEFLHELVTEVGIRHPWLAESIDQNIQLREFF